MKNMDEKKKILVSRIIWLSILLIFIFLPVIVMNAGPELKLLDSQCYTYDGSYYTECEIELKFNRKVESGYAEIEFYDAEGNLIENETAYFFESGKVVNDSVYVYGEIDTYEIVLLDFEVSTYNIEYMFFFIPLILIFFVMSLMLSYKEYDFNGRTISVYAGLNKHYLKIDGEKYDEHNSIVAFTPIKLSTKLDDNEIEATISLTNSITLKINNKLQQQKKTK